MSIVEWFSLALVCFLGAATPGPSLAIIINNSLRHGINSGRLSSISHAVAIGLYALAAVLGLAALFEMFPLVADIFVYAGAAYLGYLGIKLLKAAYTPTSNAASESHAEQPAKNEGVKQAFLIAFLNPKIAVFFLALFSQFIPSSGASLSLTAILVGTVLFIDMFWYLAVVQVVERMKSRFTASGSMVKKMLFAQGFVFVVLAINAVLVNNNVYQF